MRRCEDRLAKMPEVRSWFANVGHGNPLIYYNIIVRNDAAHYGELFVRLHEYDTRRTPATPAMPQPSTSTSVSTSALAGAA